MNMSKSLRKKEPKQMGRRSFVWACGVAGWSRSQALAHLRQDYNRKNSDGKVPSEEDLMDMFELEKLEMPIKSVRKRQSFCKEN